MNVSEIIALRCLSQPWYYFVLVSQFERKKIMCQKRQSSNAFRGFLCMTRRTFQSISCSKPRLSLCSEVVLHSYKVTSLRLFTLVVDNRPEHFPVQPRARILGSTSFISTKGYNLSTIQSSYDMNSA
jgi:hypothetical protein